MKKLFVLLNLLLLILITSCISDVKYQENRWDNNVQRITKLETKYYCFRELFDERLSEAKNIIKDTSLAKTPENKVKIIESANVILEAEYFNDLEKIDIYLSYINDNQSELMNSNMKGYQNETFRNLNTRNDTLHTFYKKYFFSGKSFSSTESINIIISTYQSIYDLYTKYDDLVSSVQQEERDKQRIKDLERENEKLKNKKEDVIIVKESNNSSSNSYSESKETKKSEPKTKTVKCEYCGNSNTVTIKEESSYKCNGCGAPLPVN